MAEAINNTVWNYDGVNATDPGALVHHQPISILMRLKNSTFPLVEMMHQSGTGGVVVNIVTKRAGNKWEGNASYFYAGDSLQGDNTPDELAAIGAKSNRLDEVKD